MIDGERISELDEKIEELFYYLENKNKNLIEIVFKICVSAAPLLQNFD